MRQTYCTICIPWSQSHLLCLWPNREWENIYNEWRPRKQLSRHVLSRSLRYFRYQGSPIPGSSYHRFVFLNLLRQTFRFTQQPLTAPGQRRWEAECEHYWTCRETNKFDLTIHGDYRSWKFSAHNIPK